MADLQSYAYSSGIGSSAAYQVTGYPWVTASVVDPAISTYNKIQFPNVCKAFTIIHVSGTQPLMVFFGPDPTVDPPQQITNGHYLSVPTPSSSFKFDVRVKELYVYCTTTGSFQILGEMTSIQSTNMFALTGSGIDE